MDLYFSVSIITIFARRLCKFIWNVYFCLYLDKKNVDKDGE